MSAVDQLVADMKRSPAKAVMLAAGLVVAGFVWVPRLRSAAASPGAGAPAVGTDGLSVQPVPTRSAAEILQEFATISADAQRLRDHSNGEMPVPGRDPFHGDPVAEVAPVEPLPVPPSPVPQDVGGDGELSRARALILTGVFVYPHSRSAVVDGEILREGDAWRDFTIIEIKPRQIRVRGAHGVYQLSMGGDVRTEESD